jgi:hypothetical protein
LKFKSEIVVENVEDAKRIGLESRDDGQITVWDDVPWMADGNWAMQVFGE